MTDTQFLAPTITPDEVAAVTGVAVIEQPRDDVLAVLDELATRFLDMSGDEFLARWDAGEFAGADDPNVSLVATCVPLAD